MHVEPVMRRDVPTCQPFEKLLAAASMMDREDVGCLPVVAADGSGRLVGILSDRDVTIAAARDETSLVDLQVRSALHGAPASCSPEEPLLAALRRMGQARACCLPVLDASARIVGLISLGAIAGRLADESGEALRRGRAALLRALAERSEAGPSAARAADVGDLMTREVVTCLRDESVARAARRLWFADVSAAPVLADATDRRVVGFLSTRDVCRAVASGRRLDALPVHRAMRAEARTCWSSDALEAAEAIMRAHRVRRLPVVGPDGRLLGLLSLSDLARSAAARGEDRVDAEVMETYMEVSGGSDESE